MEEKQDKKDKNMNKKGQLESIILGAIVIFVIGAFLFFFNHVFDQIEDELGDYFTESTDYNQSYAHTSLTGINTASNAAWDYVFLAMAMGMVIILILFSFATRIHPAFFGLYAIFGMVILVAGVIMSNIWQEISGNAEFTETVTRFPITNAILGNGFVLFILSLVVILSIIVLFGKRGGDEI